MPQIIPKRVIEEIRFGNDIADVIGERLTLKRAGTSFKALCPFHKEKTPSFHVNTQKQIYHCFGCGAGGDVFGFIMQFEGLDFVTAAKLLAQRAGVRLELEEGDEALSDRDVLFRILSRLAELYHQALLESKSGRRAREYLEARNLDRQVLDEFLIGYAPERWDAVCKWGRKEKYSLEQMVRSGMVVPREKPDARSDGYDRFRNRIMFPIWDEQGRVIGFSGRTLDDKAKTAKYVNSPESPLFRKSRVLYALEKARRHIVESREAIVCEGQIDVIRCHQAGFQTAVAAQGTAFTDDHVRILRRYTDTVTIVFDSDRAGQDAAMRAATAFMSAGLAVRIASVPPGSDPDTFINEQGADAFRHLLSEASSAVSFQVQVLSEREDANSEVGAMRISREVLNTISATPNAVQRAKLLQEAAACLGVPERALAADLRHANRRRGRAATAASNPSRTETERRATRPQEEVALCEHLVHAAETPEISDLVREYLPTRLFRDPACRTVAEAALKAAETGRDIQDLIRDGQDPESDIMRFAAEILMAPDKIAGKEFSRLQAVKDQVLFMWRRELKRELDELTRNPDTARRDRRVQLRYDLNVLKAKNWMDGSAIIKIELSE